jgi:cell division transport system permease protein
MVAALLGVLISIAGLITVRALFLENALNQFYQANLIARIDYADILYIAPILLFVGVAMAGVTAYVTLRLYVRR